VDAPQDRLDVMTERMKALDYRMTPQRRAVLKVLAESREHPTVDQIYERVKADFPMTSLATIYKTVTLLKEIGEVMELNFSGGRSRYDGFNPSPHPHLYCIKCERVTDPDIETFEGLSEELSASTGYEIVGQRLDFFGVCPRCQGIARS